MNVIAPVDGTNNIRYADFIRITTPDDTYRFTTAPSNQTITAVDASAFDAVGVLIKVGEAQRDIKSTANETTITMVGIDTSMLGIVLNSQIKGSQIELWHAFFDSNNQLITANGTGVYKYFNGYINSFAINEDWMEEIRAYVGTVTVNASSFQLVLQNRTSGRYTNSGSWNSFNPTDTSMGRVAFISTINYAFGKTA
jgi:hypothetical protein